MHLVVQNTDITNTTILSSEGGLVYDVSSMWNWRHPTHTKITKCLSKYDDGETIAEMEWHTLEPTPTLIYVGKSTTPVPLDKYFRGTTRHVQTAIVHSMDH